MNKFSEKWNSIPITVKVSIAYTICSILQKCLSFITLPLFTRLLTTEQYGQYSVYASWSTILSIFVTLNLGYGSFQTAMSKYEKDRDRYIASVQGISLLLLIVFLGIYLPFRSLWNSLLEMPTYLVLVLVLELVTQSAFLFWSTKKRFEYKYKSVVALTLLVSALSPILAYILVVNVEEKGHARIIGYASVNIILGLFFVVFNFYKGKNLFVKEYWKYALSFNIPLIPYYLSQVVFNQSDRIMISKYCGTDKAGIYSVAYSLAIILNFVLNAINNSYVPWLYEKIKEKNYKENKQVACLISILMAVLLLGVIWITPEFIYIMAGKEYYEAIWVVAPVAISILLLFYSQLFINVMFYYEQKALLVWASLGAAVVNIILNVIFIPMFGFIAAGYTTLVSYILFAAANYWGLYIASKDKKVVAELYDLKWLTVILLAMCVLSAIGMLLYDFIIVRYAIIVIVLLVLLINYKQVIKYLQILKNM